jgi:hypothetical protein
MPTSFRLLLECEGLVTRRRLKKSARLSCSFGLSSLFGCVRLTRWIRKTGLVRDIQASETQAYSQGFSNAC